MSDDLVAVIGFVSLFVLMLLRVPVGMAMGLVGVTGFAHIVGAGPALKMVGQTSMRTVTDFNFAVVPMFLLMGSFATTSGMSRELFRAGNAFLGHLRGGLGVATIAACGGFAAICGSSVATAATFSRVAYPEMLRFKYPQSFATGVIAAGGTLGIMIPPSTVFAVYGLITEQDVGKLFIAGILPGALALAMYMLTITLIGYARPGYLPSGQRSSWSERLDANDVVSELALDGTHDFAGFRREHGVLELLDHASAAEPSEIASRCRRSRVVGVLGRELAEVGAAPCDLGDAVGVELGVRPLRFGSVR